jgi:hypothetical protein
VDEDHKALWARGRFGVLLLVCLSANVLTFYNYLMDFD